MVEKQSNLSSDKLLYILETMAKFSMPVRLQDLAEKTEMTQSTVLRYLRALQNSNYLYQDRNTLRYGLTWKLCGLTKNLDTYLGLRNVANSFVNELANTLRTGVCLVVSQNNECIYLDCIDRPAQGPIKNPLQYIGKRAPMHTTGSGKLLLSSYSPVRLDQYVAEKGLKPVTPYSITSREQLDRELDAVRQQGYACDNQECEIGLRCISYPIYDYSTAMYAAISVFHDVHSMTDSFIEEQVRPILSQTATEISRRLGYDG